MTDDAMDITYHTDESPNGDGTRHGWYMDPDTGETYSFDAPDQKSLEIRIRMDILRRYGDRVDLKDVHADDE